MALHLWQIMRDIPLSQTHAHPPVLSVLTKLHYGQAEKRLMLAVLIDAIDRIAHYDSGRGAKNWGDCQDALKWVLACDPHWLFSFENICATLELDSAKLRSALQAEFPSLFFIATRANTYRQRVLVDLQPVRG